MLFTRTNRISARAVAMITAFSMIISAFPASFFGFNFAEAANVDAVGTITVSAVPNAPIVADLAGEYFTVGFSGTGTLNLDGWTVDDGDNVLGYTFSGISLVSGDVYKVCANASSTVNGGMTDCDADWGGGFKFDNGGDDILLLDDSATTVLAITYPLAADGEVISDSVVVDYTPPACTPQFDSVATSTSVQNIDSGDFFDSVQDAIDDCDTEDGHTIAITGDQTLTSQISIDKEITLEGNDNTIFASFVKTTNSNNSAIGIAGTDNVTVQNVIVDGAAGTDLHGINVYESEDVTVTMVTAKSFRSGMVVNGSKVTASDFSTSGNVWHGINVAQGSGVTDPAVLTISNTSMHAEGWPTLPHIFIDDITQDATVVDVDSQYSFTEFPFKTSTARAYYLTPDETKPTVAITTPLDDATVAPDFTVTGTATDTDSGIDYVLYTVTEIDALGGSYVANVTSGTATGAENWEFSLSGLASGFYRLKVQAFDVAGNWKYAFHDVYVDAEKPTIVVHAPVDNLVTNGDFAISVTATDDVEIAQVVINIKDEFGGHIGTCLNEADTASSSYTTGCTVLLADYVDGIYQFKTNARDGAGNLSNTITQTFEFSTERPEIVVNSPVDNYMTDENFDISVTATDDVEIAQVVINIKDEFGGHIGTCLNEAVSASSSYTTGCTLDVSGLADGIYQFRTNARDNAGNLSNTINQTFIVNTTPASLEILTPEVEETVYGTYAFTAEYIDDDKTEDPIRWAIRAGSCSSNTVAGNVDGFSDSSTFEDDIFSTTHDTGLWENGEYCFVVNPDEGEDELDLRATRTFMVMNNHSCDLGVNLVANPSFELDVVSNNKGWKLFNSVTDWVVEKVGGGNAKGEIHAGVNGWSSSDGSQHIELASNQPTEWSQTVLTKPGEEYTLTLDYSPRPGTEKPESRTLVYLDGVRIKKLNKHGRDDVFWKTFTHTFVADSSSVTISFADTGTANGRGGFIDNVSLECNPPTYTIEGYKWNDLDADGFWDENEPSIEGWTIFADGNETSMSTTTDANGYYYFEVYAGAYEVYEEYRFGWTQTAPIGLYPTAVREPEPEEDEQVYPYEMASCYYELGELDRNVKSRFGGPFNPESCDFGNHEDYYEIYGYKFSDEDEDGAGEDVDGIVAGWEVSVFNTETEESMSTTTDADGYYYFTVPAGEWIVSEEMRDDWTQIAVYQNGWLVEDDSESVEVSTEDDVCTFYFGGRLPRLARSIDSEYEGGRCDFYNAEPERGGSSSSVGGIISRSSSSNGPDGRVLGASTSVCSPLLNDYLKRGEVNDAFEVLKLQLFLGWYGLATPLNAVFDAATETNVKAFQTAESAQVLQPWVDAGATTDLTPSGYVYKTTQWKINDLVCPGVAAFPQLP